MKHVAAGKRSALLLTALLLAALVTAACGGGTAQEGPVGAGGQASPGESGGPVPGEGDLGAFPGAPESSDGSVNPSPFGGAFESAD